MASGGVRCRSSSELACDIVDGVDIGEMGSGLSSKIAYEDDGSWSSGSRQLGLIGIVKDGKVGDDEH